MWILLTYISAPFVKYFGMTEATGPIGAIAVLLALSVALVGVTASPLPSVRVIAVVPVGTGPQEVAFDPLNGYLYVANTGSNNVTIINGATNTVVASVAVGRFPRATAVDDRTGNLYVTNTGSGTVSVLNGSSGTPLVTIAPPSLTGPSGIVFDPATASIYFAAYTSAPPFSGELVIVNDTTNTVVGQIPLPDLAHGLAYDPRNGLIYAGLTTSVAIIDPATRAVVATTRVGPSPVSIAIDSLNGHVFVTSLNSWNVSVLDDVNNSLIGSIPCGFQSWGVAFDTRTNEMIVTTESTASPFQNGLTVIDPVNDTISTSV